jgi:hypothetical protein
MNNVGTNDTSVSFVLKQSTHETTPSKEKTEFSLPQTHSDKILPSGVDTRQILPDNKSSPLHIHPSQQQANTASQSNTVQNTVTQSTGDSIMLNTSHGKIEVDIDAYFTPQPRGHIDLDGIPFLLPGKDTIDALSTHASAKLKGLLSEYGIPKGPEHITYDNTGKMMLPYDYEYAAEFTNMIEENTAMGRELSTINALTSHYVEIAKTEPFREEMSHASSKAEIDQIVAKYAHLLTNNKNYSTIVLSFNENGDLTPMADGNGYTPSV